MAIEERHDDRPAAAGPQQRGGRPGESFLCREECAHARRGRKSQTGRCGIEAGDPERRPGERIAALDPPAAGRNERRSQAVKESRGSDAFSPAMSGSPAVAPLETPKNVPHRVIEREEDRRAGPSPIPERGADADSKTTTAVTTGSIDLLSCCNKAISAVELVARGAKTNSRRPD
jgi:hypothetical protein